MSLHPRSILVLVLVSVPGVLGSSYGCRFVREPANPYLADGGTGSLEPSETQGSTVAGAAGAGGAADAPAQPGGGGGSAPEPSGDSGSAGSAGAAGAHSLGGGGGAPGVADEEPPADAAVPADSGSSCSPPHVDVCNPVIDDGCPDSMQCAVDLAAPSMAGYCIFSTPGAVPDGTCLNTLVTESCPPTQTCFDGRCRALCFCDDDCEEGECCVEPIGEVGFKACGSC